MNSDTKTLIRLLLWISPKRIKLEREERDVEMRKTTFLVKPRESGIRGNQVKKIEIIGKVNDASFSTNTDRLFTCWCIAEDEARLKAELIATIPKAIADIEKTVQYYQDSLLKIKKLAADFDPLK